MDVSLLTEQGPTGSTKMGDAAVKSAMMEPATLPWPGDRMSVRSDVSLREAASWTESERGEEAGLRTQLEAEPAENHLPEKAAQVFSPAVTVLHSTSSPRGSEAFWEMESEKSPFLGSRGITQDYNQHGCQYEWAEDTPPSASGRHGDVPEPRAAETRPAAEHRLRPGAAGLLGGRSVRQQHPGLRVRPLLPAERRHDGGQLLLHLHGGGVGLHLQPPGCSGGADSTRQQTEVLRMRADQKSITSCRN